MDVRDEASVEAGVRRAAEATGGLDALVCAAGYGVFGSVEETSSARARAQLETNYFGTLLPLRAVLPAMRARGAGRIVVVGSLAGRAPIPFQAHYSASKAAVDALVLALRNELTGTGVHVRLVEPGDIRTPFNDRMDWGGRRRAPTATGCAGARGWCASRFPARRVRRSWPRPSSAPSPRGARACATRSVRTRLAVPLGRRLLPDALALALIRRHFEV